MAANFAPCGPLCLSFSGIRRVVDFRESLRIPFQGDDALTCIMHLRHILPANARRGLRCKLKRSDCNFGSCRRSTP